MQLPWATFEDGVGAPRDKRVAGKGDERDRAGQASVLP